MRTVIVGCRAGIRMKAGTPKAAMVSRKDSTKPDRMAGATSGKVMERVMRARLAPRVRAAFSYSLGACSSAAATRVNG